MQISIKGYITSKESELFYDCADRYAYDKSQNKFAISDGVSKSFFPKIWADILVNKWVESKEFDEAQFILDCQKNWLEQVTEIVNQPNSKWFTKNAFNRKESGLATFVGLRFYKKKKEWFWKASALGDSFLFFLPMKFKDFSKECIVLSSKKEPIVFDNFPDYLSSLGNNHKGERQLEENPLTAGTFFLMTDALAEWFLSEKKDAINKIQVWQNQKDFERFVEEERHSKKLGNDDSALLIIKVDGEIKDKPNYVEEEVSDINELIRVQQNEIETIEKIKEQESILQKENSKPEILLAQIEPLKIVVNKLPEELEAEIKKPKEGLVKPIFVKEENECSNKKGAIENDEKAEILEEPKEEKERSKQGEDNNIEIKKSPDFEQDEIQELETDSKEEPKLNTKGPSKDSQNITDKF